jgi:hypothetical protein
MENNKENKDLQEGLHELFSLRRRIREDLEFANSLGKKYRRKKRRRKIKIIIISTSAAAILLISLWLVGPALVEPESSKLYNNYYSVFDPDIEYREDAQDTGIGSGLNFYIEGESAKALDVFYQMEKELSGEPSFEFYYSLILMDNQLYEQAKQKLAKLKEKAEFMLPEVCWYLALVGVIQEDYEEAKINLRLMRKENPEAHRKEARKLLRIIRFK